MEQINDSVYYDSNSDADDNDGDVDNTFQDVIQIEDVIEDTEDDGAVIYGKTINNDFMVLVGTEDETTGVTIEYEGVLYTQYCHYGEVYYQSCEIYVDDPAKTKEAIDMMAKSSELWSLCDDAPPLLSIVCSVYCFTVWYMFSAEFWF